MRKRAGETSRVFSWAVGGGESAGSRTGAAGARSEEGARREERWVAKKRARGEGRGGGIALLRALWGVNERRLACIFGELSSRCGTLRGSGAARGSRWGKTGNAVQAMSGRTSAPGRRRSRRAWSPRCPSRPSSAPDAWKARRPRECSFRPAAQRRGDAASREQAGAEANSRSCPPLAPTARLSRHSWGRALCARRLFTIHCSGDGPCAAAPRFAAPLSLLLMSLPCPRVPLLSLFPRTSPFLRAWLSGKNPNFSRVFCRILCAAALRRFPRLASLFSSPARVPRRSGCTVHPRTPRPSLPGVFPRPSSSAPSPLPRLPKIVRSRRARGQKSCGFKVFNKNEFLFQLT